MPKVHSPTEARFERDLEAAKAARWAQVLFKCARLLNERALSEVQRRSGLKVRPAHTALFPHIDLAGTRPSVLAEKLGISKQAVGQTVDELADMGVLERVPDPLDARAQLVRFTPRGRKGLLEGLAVLEDLENEMAAAVGPAQIAQMQQALSRLLEALETAAPDSERQAPRSAMRRRPRKT